MGFVNISVKELQPLNEHSTLEFFILFFKENYLLISMLLFSYLVYKLFNKHFFNFIDNFDDKSSKNLIILLVLPFYVFDRLLVNLFHFIYNSIKRIYEIIIKSLNNLKKRKNLDEVIFSLIISLGVGIALYLSLNYFFNLVEGFIKINYTFIFIFLILMWYVTLSILDSKNNTYYLSNYIFFPLTYYLLFNYFNSVENLYFVSLILISVIMFHSYNLFNIYEEDNLKLSHLFISISIILLFNGGIYIISEITSYEKNGIEFKLGHCKEVGTIVLNDAEIFCGDFQDNTIVGNMLYCKLKNIPDLSNISGSFIFQFIDGSINNTYFEKSISTIIPNNVAQTFIRVTGFSGVDTFCLMSERVTQTFPNKNEFKENKINFFTYLSAYFAFIIIATLTYFNTRSSSKNKSKIKYKIR